MKRRDFLLTLGAGSLLAGSGLIARAEQTKPQVAITIEDPNLFPTPLIGIEDRNNAILYALAGHNGLQAALFVSGQRLTDNAGRRLLQTWNRAGHILANQTFTFKDYNKETTLTGAFTKDILRNEGLLRQFGNYRKLFRFPYMRRGNTIEKFEAARAFLREHGYENGAATIDTSDWFIDRQLNNRIADFPEMDLKPFKEYFLDHVLDRATYYQDLAMRMLGRNIKHTVVLHHNLLTAYFLSDLLTRFKQSGWELINAEDAYTDPIYKEHPKIMPNEGSVVWALAMESGKYDALLRHPPEDKKYEVEKMSKLKL